MRRALEELLSAVHHHNIKVDVSSRKFPILGDFILGGMAILTPERAAMIVQDQWKKCRN